MKPWHSCLLGRGGYLEDIWTSKTSAQLSEVPIPVFKCSCLDQQCGTQSSHFYPFSIFWWKAGVLQAKGQSTNNRLFLNVLYLLYYNLLRNRPSMVTSQQVLSWRPLAWSLLPPMLSNKERWDVTQNKSIKDVSVLMDTRLNVRQCYCRLPFVACLCCTTRQQTPQWVQS